MSTTPEYAEEELVVQEEDRLRESPACGLPRCEDVGEREVEEHRHEDDELAYLDPSQNEARAPGVECGMCGVLIGPDQDARLLPDGRWIHQVCPTDGAPGMVADEAVEPAAADRGR